MLDSSKGLANNELPAILQFIEDIVRRLYTNPHNIQIGLMYYSDLRTARFALVFKKRSLRHALIGIRKLRWRYRQGRKNYLGYALRMVRQVGKIYQMHINKITQLLSCHHGERSALTIRHIFFFGLPTRAFRVIVIHVVQWTNYTNHPPYCFIIKSIFMTSQAR